MRVLIVHYDFTAKPIGTFFVDKLLQQEWDLLSYPLRSITDNLNPEDPPDVVILCHVSRHRDWKNYQRIRRAWDNSTFVITITEEPFDIFHSLADWSFSFKPNIKTGEYINPGLAQYGACIKALMNLHKTQKKQIKSPTFQPLFQDADNMTLSDIQKFLAKCRDVKKDRFCNFIYRNRSVLRCPGVRQRNKLCRNMMQYKKVDCAGRTMNNTDELYKMEREKTRDVDRLKYMSLEFMAKYKFTIAGENRFYPYYISEKVLFPLLVGSIPIYSGTCEISRLLNPKCFINCNDYGSLADVVDRVKEIDSNPKLYEEYLNAPIFLNDSLVYYMDEAQLKAKIQPLLEAVTKFIDRDKTKARRQFGNNILNNRVLAYLEYRTRKILS